MEAIIYLVLAILVSYALGSISFAVIFSWAFAKRDVRKMGSGNAGTTNVVRTVGALPGILTFVMDFLKGLASAYFGGFAFSFAGEYFSQPIFNYSNGALLCGAICLIGHIYPVFFDFKGGKGVATSAGILLALSPWALLAGAASFAVLFFPTGIISLGSLAAAVSVPIAVPLILNNLTPYDVFLHIFFSLLMAITVILKHKDNIKRLIKGEEKPIKAKKR